MPLRYFVHLPRRYWLPVGLVGIALCHLPLLLLGAHHPSVLVLPLVMTSVALMITQKHGGTVVCAAVVFALLAGLPHILADRPLPPPSDNPQSVIGVGYQWQNVAVLILAHALVGLSHFVFVRSPFSPQQAQSRLAGRLKRQTEALEAARVSQQNAELEAETRTTFDRKRLLEHLPVHLVLKDVDGRFTFVSKSFCDLVEREFDEIIGMTDFDLFPDDLARKFVKDDQAVMRSGTVFNDVEETIFPDGTCSYMQVRKAAIRESSGEIVGVQGIFWDVTEEYSRRKELQRIESRAHALINAALDAVLIVDGEGHVLDANPASEKILGYTQDQVAMHPPIGEIMQTSVMQAGQRKSDSPDDKASFRRKTPINKVLKECTGRRIEVKLRRRDAVWFDAEISAHPLTVEDSQGWAIFIRDISRRKRFEQELRDAKDIAEQANATKTEFVANVSHELRTPLTGIMGLQELLAQSDLDKRQQNYNELSKVSASNLLSLIDDLLDFSKIESGRIEIEQAEFDVAETVQDAAISMAARAQLKGLELLVDLPNQFFDHPSQNAPPQPTGMRAIGDAHRIRQIILNLVGNAIKFTSQGQVRVRARVVALPTRGDQPTEHRLRIEVHDSGIGVSPEQRQIIFEAFRQADASTTRKFGGTGLGLTICRDIVAQMRGTIGVTNALTIDGEPTHGSCFFFEIPTELVVSGWSDAGQPIKRTEHVVLAMHTSPMRELVRREIARLGYSVTVMSTEEMIAQLSDQLFAAGNHTIVVTDGRELACWNSELPPVVLRWVLLNQLASVQLQEVPGGLKHAEVFWLPHPFRRTELREALQVSAEHAPPQSSVDGIDGDSEPPGRSTRSAKVLLVEDSPINQTVLGDMLSSLNHNVTYAGTGQEAIDACESGHFDLVLMDIQMPVIDGLEATAHIRASEKGVGRRQLICALTAHAGPEDRQRCADAGMDMFLEKPVPIESLRDAVRCALTGNIPDFAALGAPDPSGDIVESETLNSATVGSELPVNDQEQSDVPKSNSRRGEEAAGGGEEAGQLPLLQRERAFESAPDWHGLLKMLHNNEQLTMDVLTLLQREVPSLTRQFARQLDAADAKQTRRAVHTIKSNARQVGLKRIAQYTAVLEDMARDEQLDKLQQHKQTVLDLGSWVAEWARTIATEKSK
ncbi:MAG: hypothetical protein Aurels2KO_00690 [Aureliella sp.]